MTNDIDIKLIGDKEILAAFRELDSATQYKRLHQVLNHAGNLPAKAMRVVIPVRDEKLAPPSSGARAKRRAVGGVSKWHPPGLGRKSVMKKRGRSKSQPTLFIGLRTKTGNYRTDAYYLRIWDLYSPGNKKIATARDRASIQAQREIFNSMRKIIERAWAKHARR
jgi:hypothetical protein